MSKTKELLIDIIDCHCIGMSDEQISFKLNVPVQDVASVINDFDKKFETSERLFINPEKLTEYIPWASGKVFSSEVSAALSNI